MVSESPWCHLKVHDGVQCVCDMTWHDIVTYDIARHVCHMTWHALRILAHIWYDMHVWHMTWHDTTYVAHMIWRCHIWHDTTCVTYMIWHCHIWHCMTCVSQWHDMWHAYDKTCIYDITYVWCWHMTWHTYVIWHSWQCVWHINMKWQVWYDVACVNMTWHNIRHMLNVWHMYYTQASDQCSLVDGQDQMEQHSHQHSQQVVLVVHCYQAACQLSHSNTIETHV